MKLSKIKPSPKNPRVIRDKKFEELKKSIQDFPKMMALRPIIINDQNEVIGGNMRLRALQELGYKEIPDEWVKKASDFTEEEIKEFMIKDNVNNGEWDFDVLGNEWDDKNLKDWGVISWDSDFDPNVKPTIDTTDVTAQQVDAAGKKLDERMEGGEPSIIDTVCPKCGEEFSIKINN